MVVSTESPLFEQLAEEYEAVLARTYEHATVYADVENETVLHEGGVRILGNGWVELDTGRLLSPDAVHHVDPHGDERTTG